MCIRLNQHLTRLERREFQRTGVIPDWWVGQFNVGFTAPTLMMVRDGGRQLVSEVARWGLVPSWSTGPEDPRCRDNFHARGETLHQKPSFREALLARRCVIPVAGFFVLEDIGRGERQTWYVKHAEGELLLLAGLYELWTRGDETVRSVAVVTSPPTELVARVHDRMAVVLDEPGACQWLDQGGQAMLCPCPENWLTMYPVSDYATRPQSDGPRCIEPVNPQKFLF